MEEGNRQRIGRVVEYAGNKTTCASITSMMACAPHTILSTRFYP